MIDRARVVVVGGGIGGVSTLYHLTKLGWHDVALLEANELTSGSTWHAAGLCTQFNQSYNLMGLLKRSLDLYEALGAETGRAVDLHRCGSVRIATSDDRLHQFEQVLGIAESLGVPMAIVSAGRASELFPLARVDDVLAAAHLPTDGHIDPTSVTNALARGATDSGATIVRHTRVTGLVREGDAWTVTTSGGPVRADHVVIAAGQWSREVARLAGVELPLVSLQHHYVVTEPIAEIQERTTELPVFRDPDNSFYARQEGGGLLVGPFERNPKTWALDGVPQDFHGKLLSPDLEQVEDCLVAAAGRIPLFGDVGLRTVVNGPDAYTPDGKCLMGPIPSRPGLHVLAGFSIFGIVFGGGAGQYAAEWIVEGQPSDNMWELDVRRFGEYASSTTYVVARASEVFEDEYKIHFPEEERPAGRPLKTDPLYDVLLEKHAVMGVRSGWERPLWFSRNGPACDEYSFGRGNWFDAVRDECRAVRSGVGVLDQTSFAKFMVSGEGARALLDRLCSNRLPAEEGRVSLTQMLTPKGGIEADVTVTLLEGGGYYVVSAAATETHDLAWIQRHAPADGSVEIANVTDRYGVLTIAGPAARKLLQRLSDDDLRTTRSPSSAPATSRSMCIASSPCASRTSASWVGSSTTQSSCSAPFMTCSTTAGLSSASSTSAIGRLSRCAWKSVTGSGGRTCRRTGHPCRPGSSASWPSTRKTSSGGPRSCASASRAFRTVSAAWRSTRTEPTHTGTSPSMPIAGSRSPTCRRVATATRSGSRSP